MRPSNPIPMYYLIKKIYVHAKTYTQEFITDLLIIEPK